MNIYARTFQKGYRVLVHTGDPRVFLLLFDQQRPAAAAGAAPAARLAKRGRGKRRGMQGREQLTSSKSDGILTQDCERKQEKAKCVKVWDLQISLQMQTHTQTHMHMHVHICCGTLSNRSSLLKKLLVFFSLCLSCLRLCFPLPSLMQMCAPHSHSTLLMLTTRVRVEKQMEMEKERRNERRSER